MLVMGQVVFDPPLPRNGVINFPDTPVDNQSVIVITAQNRGNENGRITFNDPGNPFSIEPRDQNIPGGAIVMFNLTFAPDRAGEFRAELTGGVAFGMAILRIGPVNLTGRGIEENEPEPDIWVQPEEIIVEILEEGDPIERILTIGNRGDGVLAGRISVEQNDWFPFNPLEIEVAPEREIEIPLVFDAQELENGEYETNLIIESNDQDDPEIIVPLRLLVDIPEIILQNIELERGWSMISTNLDFGDDFIDEEGPDMQLILAGIIEQVILIKDGDGRFCTPDFNFWGIPFWNTASGYLIKTTEETELEIEGVQIPFDRQIELNIGWNMIAFYPTYDLSFGEAFEELVEHDLLILAKNGHGQFYSPEWEFGFDIPIHHGEGILVKMTENCAFRYPEEP